MVSAISGKANLKDHVALVTGGANGIGRSVALTLAREGADVIVSDLAPTLDTEEQIKAMGRNGIGLQCDVSKKTDVTRLVDNGINHFGKIDIVVHVAGINGIRMDNFLDLEEDEWDRVMDTNLKGTFFILQAILPHMKERQYGKIVCVGSLAGKIGSANSGPHYVASKGGIHALVKWASINGAAHGVTVNGIAPGPVNTDMIKGLAYPDHLLPLKRLGEPEDIAEAALFLSSQSSDWITGIVLDVNGGFFVG